MTRFLARVRRFFLAGTVSLIIYVILSTDVIRNTLNGLELIYYVYMQISPILYTIFVIASCIFIRKKGQFASVHSKQLFIVSVSRCIWHDMVSPFKNIISFISLFVSKNNTMIPKDIITKMRLSSLILFIWTILLIVLNLIGIRNIIN